MSHCVIIRYIPIKLIITAYSEYCYATQISVGMSAIKNHNQEFSYLKTSILYHRHFISHIKLQ